MTKVAAIQMNSGAEVAANLALADRLLGDAAADGCALAVLPENFALMPVHGRDKADHAEVPGDGPVQAFLADAAKRHGLWIIGGSMPLISPEEGRVYGACVEELDWSAGEILRCLKEEELDDNTLAQRLAVLAQVQQVTSFLKVCRGYSSVTYVEKGALVTHSEMRFKDLKE